MYRYLTALFMLTATLACQQPASRQQAATADTVPAATAQNQVAAAPDPAYEIIPGKRIGMTVIQANADSLLKTLGKPDMSDAAMGTYFNAWYSKHPGGVYQTSIYSQRNMGGKDEAITHVKTVYVSSPAFKTTTGIGAGSTLEQIQQQFNLKKTGKYNKGHISLQVYEDLSQGISFEFDPGNKCRGMWVYAPQDSSSARLSMHSGMSYNP
ncbi:hypothetical protein ECE50_030475 (plasmid) [Chitinophaga sp. Mgbs1]|uniref:Uncharacterized protein n=1 Tax=Chitinophaga solisilvae TaxID=1233460 RepID=A0A433WLW6_9BACT|nr:hypothetical protein [Chitinophaga solisilvae]